MRYRAFQRILEASFRVDVDDRAMMKRQFDLFAATVERVAVKRLVVPDGLAPLDDACAAIEADWGP